MSEAPARPDRPLVPTAFWALLVAVACMRVVLGHGLATREALLCALPLCGGLAVCSAVRRLRPAAVTMGALAVVALCSGLLASAEVGKMRALADALSGSAVSGWEITVETDMAPTRSGSWRGRATVRRGDTCGSVWLAADEAIPLGSKVSCVGGWRPNADDDWGAASRMQGIAGTVRVVRVLGHEAPQGMRGAILGVRSRVLESLGPGGSDVRSVLAGGVCGWSVDAQSNGVSSLFSACGVSHLVAVSGSHLALVMGMAAELLQACGVRPRVRAVALLALGGSFVTLCGAPVSAQRALAMCVVAQGAQLAGRRSHALTSVSVAALAMALAEPGVTGQLGYLLSVTSVCALCLFGPHARYVASVLAGRPPQVGWLPKRVARRVGSGWHALLDLASVSLVCQLATLPITLPAFGTLSLVAPLANVVLSAPFGLLLALGLASAALVFAPPAQALVLALADAVGWRFLAVLRWFGSLPLSSLSLSVDEGACLAVASCLAVALLLWWPRVTRRGAAAVTFVVALLVAVTLARWRFFSPARVCVLDVGQGDAILVQDGAAAVLVDTGPGSAAAAALGRTHVLHLDAVLLTHLHDDHTGGLSDVATRVGCESVVVAQGVAAELPEELRVAPAAEVALGDVLRVGRFRLTVVSPEGLVDGSQNEHSVELLVEFDDGERRLSGLLTGDAERDQTAQVVEKGLVADVDFLKVGHHGSAVSISPDAARVLDPEVSVASAGESNSYGHPTRECVDVLESVGSEFLCTKDVGDVTIEPGASGPRVTCERSCGKVDRPKGE